MLGVTPQGDRCSAFWINHPDCSSFHYSVLASQALVPQHNPSPWIYSHQVHASWVTLVFLWPLCQGVAQYMDKDLSDLGGLLSLDILRTIFEKDNIILL